MSEDIEDIRPFNKKILDVSITDKVKDYVLYIIDRNPKNNEEFNKYCTEARRKMKIQPKKAELVHCFRNMVINSETAPNDTLDHLMTKKLVRSNSGVNVITVLTSPYPSYVDDYGDIRMQRFSCGKNCLYCPDEPKIVLNCTILSKNISNTSCFVELKSEESLDEVRVLTFLTVKDQQINCKYCEKFNIEEKTLNVAVDQRYSEFLIKGEKILATKIDQPKSYISTEPAVRRANQNNFDPKLQFDDRASSLEVCGHLVDKVELNIKGGTWSHYPIKYQEWFITSLYYSANVYRNEKRPMKTLKEEIEINQKATVRIIGLTIETRPDAITKYEIKRLRKYNVTRVEMGVQHLDDDILRLIKRECYLEDTINSIKLLKMNGFKVDIHLMPDLPGSNFQKDLEMFRKLLACKISLHSNITHYDLVHPELQADQWKIYPTEVTRWTGIKELFDKGEYKPYADEINPETGRKYIIDLILYVKQHIYHWVRLNRIVRDIPSHEIFGGNDTAHLRDEIHKILKQQNKKCNCIRCREVKDRKIDPKNVVLLIKRYNDANGTEYFLSYEEPMLGILVGFCRLRLNNNDDNVYFDSIKYAALIRELHVYGIMTPHYVKNNEVQHFGYGQKLLKEAEKIAYENGFKKMAVISGVGVREYYQKKAGYKLDKEADYLIKDINFFTHNYNSIVTFTIIPILALVFYYLFQIKLSSFNIFNKSHY